MRGISKFFLLLAILLNFSSAFANIVRVHIFNQYNIKTVAITPIEGKYQFSTENGFIYKLKKNHIVYFTAIGDSITVWDADRHLGIFNRIQFRGLTNNNIFSIESAFPALPKRIHEGDLSISAKAHKLDIINFVSEENYLAGVIEAESGPKAHIEFYKTQAIISRTYLYSKIAAEGETNYFLGDDVNYQVYKGMCHLNPDIRTAVTHTNNLVIVDTLSQLITATFHANSGGETVNSEDYWLTETSYLKATPDPFSLNQRSAVWVDSIPINKWLTYLGKNGIDVKTDKGKIENLYFEQPYRKKYYIYNNDSILTRKIRTDFKLRSTWFSIYPSNGYVYFNGRGYGHGVGLSQDGAMQMAKENFSFNEIIHFYYKNIKVVSFELHSTEN